MNAARLQPFNTRSKIAVDTTECCVHVCRASIGIRDHEPHTHLLFSPRHTDRQQQAIIMMADEQQQQHMDYPEAEYDSGVVYHGTNEVPRTPAGTTLHMDLKEGDVANRIVTVGDPVRAARIAAALDEVRFHKVSARGFVTYTGSFEGVEVSIISIGMGLPMADFFVRETRQIVTGPMLVARYGTCGVLHPDIEPGGVLVATEGSVLVQRNPDAFLPPPMLPSSSSSSSSAAEAGAAGKQSNGGSNGGVQPYVISRPQPADSALSDALIRELGAELGVERVRGGMNASADSFYSSQGRADENFDDANAGLLDRLRRECPPVVSMEMETFQLFALGNATRSKGSQNRIRAAAAAIGLANRSTGKVCAEATLDDLEYRGGTAVLRALVRTALE